MSSKILFKRLISGSLSLAFIACTQSSDNVAFEGSSAKLPQTVIREKLADTPDSKSLHKPIAHDKITPQPLPKPSVVLPALPTTPKPQAPTNEIPQPEQITQTGEVAFGVYGILNMDTQHQITNDGFRVQVSQNNEVLVTGDLDVTAIIEGEPIDFDPNNDVLARPILLRTLNPKYVSPRVASISGTQKATVSVCLPQDRNQSYSTKLNCQDLNSKIGHANGINTLDSIQADVDFRANNSVLVKKFYNIPRRAGDSCSAKNGLPCVALGHPALAGYTVSAGQAGNDVNSPLVLDLNKDNKANLVNVWDDKYKVHFDLTASGKKLRTGWVLPQDGLLVYDVNKNGKIDNGNELFGQQSFALHGKENQFDHGYLALAQHDHNKDKVINAKDKIFKKLRVWQDLNSDGISQRKELKSLAYYKITDIKTNFTKVALDKIDVEQNKVYLESTLTTKSDLSIKTFDVWFGVRPHEGAILSQSRNN